MSTEYSRQYYEKNKAKIIERSKQWEKDNPEKAKLRRLRYEQTTTYQAIQRNASYKRKYGLTLEEYNERLLNQNYLCAICKKEETRINTRETDGKKHLVVDHEHITGKVRGLLCTKCNSILGFSMDDIQILENAILYIKENR